MSLRSTLALAGGGEDDAGGLDRTVNDGASERPRPGDLSYNPRLADGFPLTYAFYPDVNAPVVSKALEVWAKSLFRQLITEEPDLLAQCEGKTLDEARALLVAAGVEGVPRVTRQVTMHGSGRYRIEPNVTGVTPLSSGILVFGRSGRRGQRLMQATCYTLFPNDDGLYFDLPPAASINMNVGLRDPDGPVFVKVDPKTWEPESGSGGGADSPAGVQSGVRGSIRDCGDVRED